MARSALSVKGFKKNKPYYWILKNYRNFQYKDCRFNNILEGRRIELL